MLSESQNQATAAQRVVEAQRGDRCAFEWLVRRYRNLVASIAYSHIGDFGRSEDIAQLTFLTAWERLGTLDDPCAIVGWLAGIARNLARNETRRAHHRSEYSENSTEQTQRTENCQSETPEDIAMRKEQQELLWSMLEKLPVNYREPLVLFYREGNSVSQVASMLELSSGTVKQRLSRGRNLLRTELMTVLEDTLRETEPSEMFVSNVMSALPVSSVLAVGGSASITKGVQFLFLKKLFGGTLMTGAIGGILGGLIGILGGVLGAWWGTKQSLNAATSQQEKGALKRLAIQVTFLALAFTALQLFTTYFVDPKYLWASIVVGSTCYAIPLFVLIIRYNRRIAAVKAEFGTEEERAAGGYATVQVKPVDLKVRRTNILAALFGSSVWVVAVAAMNWDFLGAAVMVVILVALCILAWKWMADAHKASEQSRINAKLILPLLFAQALLVGFRWNNWPQLDFGTGLAYEGWLLSAGIMALGLLIVGAIWANSVSIARQEQSKGQPLGTEVAKD